MSPEERANYRQEQVKSRKFCHRSIRTHMLAIPVAGPPSIAMPGGGQQMGITVQTISASELCQQENCQMWDEKKRRCLDRSVALARAYGKDRPAVDDV
jgi:hypothetical protein